MGLAADTTCERAAKAADEAAGLVSPPLAFRVTGTGRLQFFSAPDDACAMAGTFVVPGDALVGYSALKDWYSVMYTAKSGDVVEGWVRGERLRITGRLGPSGH